MEHQKLTEKIIGCGIEVHKILGPGFLETIYENALIKELRINNLKVESQKTMTVLYKEAEVGRHRLDLLVEDIIIVELKAIKDIANAHFSIVRSYLSAMKLKHGLILNFSKPKLEIKRVIG